MFSKSQKLINRTLIAVVGSPNGDGVRNLAAIMHTNKASLQEAIENFEEISNDVFEILSPRMRDKVIWDARGNKEISFPMEGYMAIHNNNFMEENENHNKEMWNAIKKEISGDKDVQECFLYMAALNERVYRYGKQARNKGESDTEVARKALKSLGLSTSHMD